MTRTDTQKKTIRTVVIAAVIVAVLGLGYAAFLALMPPNRRSMEAYYNRDVADLTVVAAFLAQYEADSVSLTAANISGEEVAVSVLAPGVTIQNTTVRDAVKRLLQEKGYRLIAKAGETVWFEKHYAFGTERGMAHCRSGAQKPAVPFLTAYEAMETENWTGWYYYEANYEKYRASH